MRALVVAALAVVVSADATRALDRSHDEKLEQAAAGIVAARIGPLRGGFDFGDEIGIVAGEPEYPRPAEMRKPRAEPGVWQDGLAIAVERRTGASPDL